MKVLVLFYTGLGRVGSTAGRLVQHLRFQAWVVCHRCDSVTLASWFAD